MSIIGVIGTGAVGQAVASALIGARFGARMLLVSRDLAKASACAADLADMATTLGSPATVRAVGAVEDLHGCDAVVICVRGAFTTGSGPDVRLGGLAVNSRIVRRIAVRLRGYPGVVLMVTNPVDLLTRVCAEVSGARVYGVGAGLDTARYRAVLAAAYDVPADRVAGDVIGEHGDAAVCCLSSTRIDDEPVSPDDPRTRAAIAAFRTRSTTIRSGVGRIRAGAAGAVLSALRTVHGGVDATVHLSTSYGPGQAWLGQPVRFAAGRATVRLPILTETEKALLDAANAKLINLYHSITSDSEETRLCL